MSPQPMNSQTIWGLVSTGGFTMYPLVVCSLVVWGVIFERLWSYRRLGNGLRTFHLEAMTLLLRNDLDALRSLCQQHIDLPTSVLLKVALDRLNSKDWRLKEK